MSIKRSVMVIMGLMLVVWAGGAWAIPQKLSYQGKLTDASGNALTGDYSIVFTIYDDASGGTDLWTETRSVAVSKGVYSVVLGEDTEIPTSVFDGSERWLGVKVESDSEMTPRAKMVSVGNAYMAYDSANLGGHPASYFAPSSEGGGNFILKTGDTMTGPLTVESFISAEGLVMGLTDTSNAKRIYLNTTEASGNSAVVNIGQGFDGSMLEEGSEPGSWSSQLFCQARNDGTSTNYAGLWARSDRGRNSQELIGLVTEAYGPEVFGVVPISLAALGGTDTQPIAQIGAVKGYATVWGLSVTNNNASGGGGLLVSCANANGDIARFTFADDSTYYLRVRNNDGVPTVDIGNSATLSLEAGSSLQLSDGHIRFENTNAGDRILLNGVANNERISSSGPGQSDNITISTDANDEGGSATGLVIVNSSAMTDADSRLVSIRNAGDEMAFVTKDGGVHCDGVYVNGDSTREVIYSGAGSQPGVIIQSNAPDSANRVGIAIRNHTHLGAEGTKLISFQENVEGGWSNVAYITQTGGAYFDDNVTMRQGLTVGGTINATEGSITIANHTPESSGEVGTAGFVCYDGSYLYVWVADDNVKRVALSNW